LPFLEAIREFALEVGYNNAIFVHVTLVPFIKAAGELKTKPTQQSVAKLREIGIAPHIIVCRCERPLSKEVREKISLFCNVPFEAVVEEQDVDHTIYEVPLMLQRERMDDLVCNLLRLDVPPAKMGHWQEIIRKLIAPQHRVRIGVVGKYIGLQDAYKSVYEAISHGGIANDCGVEIQRVEAEDIERDGAEKHLQGLGGILVPGGFGERGIEGKIQAARYARENQMPYLGLCLGMQIATIEFARNVLNLAKAHSTEFDPNTPHPVIAMLDAQTKVKNGTALWGFRGQRAPPPPLRIQQRLPRAVPEGGLCLQRADARRQTGRDHRAAQAPVLYRQPVSSRVPQQAAPTASAVQGLHRRGARADAPEAALASVVSMLLNEPELRATILRHGNQELYDKL
ncbi:MAG: CTP synthase, partial [Candidatus Solibacter sp.]|nr:CTP synthase [Candidatus Solibacter sp.]